MMNIVPTCLLQVQPRNAAFQQLVPLFKKDAVVHLLGFKFQNAQKVGEGRDRAALIRNSISASGQCVVIVEVLLCVTSGQCVVVVEVLLCVTQGNVL